MDLKVNIQLIQESVIGEDLSSEHCELLSKIVKRIELNAGEVLFKAGILDKNLYVLTKGKLDIFKGVGGTDKNIHIATVKKGSIIGELSFIDGLPHSMQLVANKAATLLVLSKDDFEAKLESHPKLVYNVMRSIMRYSHNLQQKMMQENIALRRMVQNSYM